MNEQMKEDTLGLHNSSWTPRVHPRVMKSRVTFCSSLQTLGFFHSTHLAQRSPLKQQLGFPKSPSPAFHRASSFGTVPDFGCSPAHSHSISMVTAWAGRHSC